MMRVIYLFIATCFMASAVVWADSHDPVELTDLSKPIHVTAENTEFTINLQSNPSTGYTWFVAGYSSDLIEPVSETYIAPDKNMPGAPGIEQWVFRVKAEAFIVPHKLIIKMSYSRPWESRSGQYKRIRIITSDADEKSTETDDTASDESVAQDMQDIDTTTVDDDSSLFELSSPFDTDTEKQSM